MLALLVPLGVVTRTLAVPAVPAGVVAVIVVAFTTVMSKWKPVKSRQLLAALLRIGWEVAWQKGSHGRLKQPGWPNYSFAFHDDEEVGPGFLLQLTFCNASRWPTIWAYMASGARSISPGHATAP